MANEQHGQEQPGEAAEPSQNAQGREQQARSATQDLADGLDLMLRAAKKAVRHVDPQNIESLGRRAFENLEALNKKRVDDIKHKARRTLDPRRIEEIAEDAGKELLKVVERVTERVDSIVTRGAGPFGGDQRRPTSEQEVSPASSESSAPEDTERSAPQQAGEAGDKADATAKRVRIEDD